MELVDIREASNILGVSLSTLRRWDNQGKLKPATRTQGGHRRYSKQQLNEYLGVKAEQENNEVKVFIYARVSTNKQKENGNLDRQKNSLMEYCINNNYKIVKIYQEVASGINENRKQLHNMLDKLDQIDKIVIEGQDKLAKSGFIYLKKLIQVYNVEIEILKEQEGEFLKQLSKESDHHENNC